MSARIDNGDGFWCARLVNRPKAKAWRERVRRTADIDWFNYLGHGLVRDKRTGKVPKYRRYRFNEPRCTARWLRLMQEEDDYRAQHAADMRAPERWDHWNR